MKKILAVLFFFLPLFALYCNSSCCERQNERLQLKEPSTQNQKPYNIKSPDTALLKNAKQGNPTGFFLNVYALLWQSKEGNLEYCAKSKVVDDNPNNLKQKAEMIIPDFGWRPGFKIDFGYFFEYDFWDLKANYTCYAGEFTHVKKHPNSILEPENNGLIPFYFFNYLNSKVSSSPRYAHATADWHMYFNSIDLEIAKNFYIRRKFTLRFLSGMKIAWINHNYKVYYNDGNTLIGADDNIDLLYSYIHFYNKSIGFGPRMGMEAKCHLKWGLSFLANGSFSTLLTKFNIKRDQDDRIFNNLTNEINDLKLILKEDFYQLKPNIQLLLGFEWLKEFDSNLVFAFDMAYEMQYFFAQNQIRRFVDDQNIGATYSNNGDLQMQGLSVAFKMEY